MTHPIPDDYPHLQLRDSGTHGLGVFATAPISAGTLVITHRGIVRELIIVPDEMRAMQIGPGLWLCQDEENDSPDNYLNHSCEPNVGFTQGTLSMFALREIQVGEEILWDYSTSMNEAGWRVRCYCGAATCRGEIRSHCDLSDAQKAKLQPLSLAYLRPSRQA
jgi:SET domain-containing protein